ncbi:MAG TPA: hypothetical protein VK923_07605 [Euzebyales bacterium]|nr:hypothetical protein [Euzebyales bacterium]
MLLRPSRSRISCDRAVHCSPITRTISNRGSVLRAHARSASPMTLWKSSSGDRHGFKVQNSTCPNAAARRTASAADH